jgi:hemerythrin-like domain-containing protein
MAVDAFEMAMVHRVFRDELRDAPGLVRGVAVGDTARSTAVGAHLDFIVAALHHHHVAEDELLWPKLRARVPAESVAVARMEAAHQSIANATTRVQAMLPSWVRAPGAPATERLAVAVAELSSKTGEHLTDEESAVVPLINAHVTEQEWREITARGAAFMSRRNVKLALVLGGMVLDGSPDEERRRFLAGVPLPQRLLVRLLADRTYAKYRTELRGGR